MRVGARSDNGLVRESNEDGFLVGKTVFAVADGMGGHRAGEVASSIVLGAVAELEGAGGPDADRLEHAVLEGHRRVLTESKRRREYAGMGTTVTAALIAGTKLHLRHVGDSRAYLVRKGRASQLTQDHSLVGDMIREGKLTEQEAMVHPHRNVLTRALGTAKEVQVDAVEIELRPGDSVILCTDGLTNLVREVEIARTVIECSDPQAAADALVDLACRRGGHDNITVVVIHLRGDAPGEQSEANVADQEVFAGTPR